MEALFELFLAIVEPIGHLFVRDKTSYSGSKNARGLKLTLFFLWLVTMIGLFMELSINIQFLRNIGWWYAASPISLLLAYFFLLFYLKRNRHAQLSKPLIVFTMLIFMFMSVVLMGIWFV